MVAPGFSAAGAGTPFRGGVPMPSRLRLSSNWILPLSFQLISFVSSLVVLNLTLSLGAGVGVGVGGGGGVGCGEGRHFGEPSERDIPTHVSTEGSSLLPGKPPCLPPPAWAGNFWGLRMATSCMKAALLCLLQMHLLPSPLSSDTRGPRHFVFRHLFHVISHPPTTQKLPLFLSHCFYSKFSHSIMWTHFLFILHYRLRLPI